MIFFPFPLREVERDKPDCQPAPDLCMTAKVCCFAYVQGESHRTTWSLVVGKKICVDHVLVDGADTN